jgi:energy-coupling factor transport system ATP-binding protein
VISCAKGGVGGVIQFDSVGFAYPGAGGFPALSRLSLTVDRGELVAVVGANGSGKSTLARLADGLLLPTSGTVTVDGMDTADHDRVWDVRSLVGMVFQDPDDQIVGTIVEDDVAFGPGNLGVPRDDLRERVDIALAAVGLSDLARREPHLLSEGQKQRVAIAGALAMRPAYLVLDEPTSMLDPGGRRSVLDLIDDLAHRDGHGVLHISHDAVGVARADRVIVLSAGEMVYDGSPPGLLSDPVMLTRAGMALPGIGALVDALRDMGAHVPVGTMDAEGLVDSLWP